VERLILAHIPAVRTWLGLEQTGQKGALI
jgi:hypothetical protein